MQRYDTTFIIDGNLPDAERHSLIEKFAGSLKRQGAEIDQIVRWGMRSLAYAMKKRTHGYFVIFYYHANPKMIASFERDLRLNENILRYMTLVFEGKHPDYIRDEGASERTIVADDSAPAGAESKIENEEPAVSLDELGEIDEEGELVELLPLETELEDEQTQEKEKE
jgi:small subunit ribosomal protein S6